MKYKLFALATVILLLSAGAILLCPDNELKWRDLQDIDAASAARAQELSGHENVTVTDLAAFELLKCNVPEDQLGKYPDDWRSMASSTGITDNISRGWDEAAHKSDLNNAINDSMPLSVAFRTGEATEPFFAHGEAQPVFRFTSSTPEGYTNANSSILRYCVYVETEYDTDSDGKRDLVKVFLQVPRAAVEGHYKAPVILETDPYACGSFEKLPSTIASSDSYDLSKLYSQPDERQVKGYESPLDLAYATGKSEWELYESTDDCNYFLVRGYAYAACAGLGTNSSEGFEVCGTDIEIKSYKSVIDWFDGNATAFTDKERCIETRAEWSEGGVGTIGLSYLGSLQNGLAAMGVDNLRTIVAEGAISNWYEYTYSQGAMNNAPSPYIWWLAASCSSYYPTWEAFSAEYHDYLSKISYDEKLLKGAYFDGSNTFWHQRDYSCDVTTSDTAVLLIHGLNDFNVKTKQFDITYRMFENAGMDVHAVLHQGGHQSCYYDMTMIGDTTSCEFLNRWLSCYLFYQDNGIADEFKILVQSNVDGSWENYDNLDSVKTETFSSSGSGTCMISVEGQKAGTGTYKMTIDDTSDVDTIDGAVKITFRASTNDVNINQVRVAVSLYDVCDSPFSTYQTNSESKVSLHHMDDKEVWVGSNIPSYKSSELRVTQSTSKMISMGLIDLHFPGATYESDTAVRQIIDAGEMYEYTVYLQPTLYSLQEGHHLEVVFGTYIDIFPDYGWLENYSYTLDISSISVEIGTI